MQSFQRGMLRYNIYQRFRPSCIRWAFVRVGLWAAELPVLMLSGEAWAAAEPSPLVIPDGVLSNEDILCPSHVHMKERL